MFLGRSRNEWKIYFCSIWDRSLYLLLQQPNVYRYSQSGDVHYGNLRCSKWHSWYVQWHCVTIRIWLYFNFLGAPGEQEAGHTKLDDMIRELSGGLVGIKHEQEYMHIRDRIHRDINESTNSKVVWWSVFEAGILILMTCGQIYYLKRFFEVKRVV